MNNGTVKASESYKKSYEYAWEVLWISTQIRFQNVQTTFNKFGQLKSLNILKIDLILLF